jgi:uncharacterized membrane protein (UPF0127 family)
MSSDDRFSFVLASILAAVVVLGVSQMRKPVVGGLPDPPRVGRTAGDLPIGPVPAGPESAEEHDEEELRGEERVRALLKTRDWPPFASLVVFHPLAGAELAPAALEQGPPYHLAVATDGSLSWTERGLAAAPSQPAGLPAHSAIRALHVALPECASAGPARLASVRALWREAARKLGGRAVLFADEVPESTARLPDGFDRTAWIAPQDSRKATTVPRGPATQPASRPGRVSIGFGRITIQAGVASTFDERHAGLSGRKSLESDEGLLFVYRSADVRSFWMKDCLISLDIIYLRDDGEVMSVTTAPPPDPKTPEADLPRYSSGAPCRLVLEVAGGLAAKMGVKAGSKVRLPESVARLFEKADS